MKMKQLTIACGLALSAMGAQAATFDAVVGGSSALEPAFKKVAADLCSSVPADSRQVFVSTSGVNTAGATGTTVVCIVDSGQAATLGVSSGDTIRIFKNSSGSGAGITQINTGAALAVPTGLTGDCTANGTTDLAPGKTFDAFKDCKTTTKPALIGIADVEPKLLAAVGGVTVANANGVTPAPLVAVQFGVPLSDKLYYTLQQAQITKGMMPSSCVATAANANGGPTDLSQDCAPSLSSTWLRGMLTGAATDWAVTGSDVAAALPTVTNVMVCRRGVTSGTQATFAARIAGTSCSTSPLTFFDNTNDNNPNNNGGAGTASGQSGYTGPTAGNYTVVINADSTAVKACLQAADTNVNIAPFAGKADAALGLLSLDQQPDGSSRWHFAKIDGVFPSNDNLIDGLYDNLYSESVITYKTSSGVPTGFSGAVYTALKGGMGSPTTINALNIAGLGAIPNGDLGYIWDSARNWATNPVMSGTRSGDTCRDAVSTF